MTKMQWVRGVLASQSTPNAYPMDPRELDRLRLWARHFEGPHIWVETNVYIEGIGLVCECGGPYGDPRHGARLPAGRTS